MLLKYQNGSLTVNYGSLNLTNGAAYIVDNTLNSDGNDIIYGTITTVSGGLSMSTIGGSNDVSLSNIAISTLGAPISLDSSFASATFNTGNKATINVSTEDSGGFVITYSNSDSYFAVTEAEDITLSKGTIKSTSTDQTIHAGSYEIYAGSLGSDGAILVTNDGNGKVSVGALDTGEIFGVGNDTYKVAGIGVVSNSKLGNDDGWDSTKGVFSVGTAFDTDILTLDESGELDFSNPNKNDAVVVDDATALTKRLAKLDYTSGDNPSFSLSLNSEYVTDSIKSIALGTNTVPLNSSYSTVIKTSQSNNTYKINGDSYLAANSALSIQSGAAASKSSLLSGAVALDSVTNTSVKITSNTISASAGDGITVTAAGMSATISALNNGDVFSVGNTAYSLTGAGLITKSGSKAKIWNSGTPTSVVIGASGLGDTAKWADVVNIADNVLAISPTVSSDESQWLILSEGYDSLYGTLSGDRNNGYTLAVDSWDSNNAVEINRAGMSVIFPAEKFQDVTIEATPSGAAFSVTDTNAFTVTSGDSTKGATIDGATAISQTAGTIALTKATQTVTTADNHAVNFVKTDEGNGITVIVSGTSATIGALSIDDYQDSFVVDEVEYQMLKNGSIWRDGDKFWLGSINDGGAVGISDLQTESNWADAIKVADGIFSIPTDIGSLSLGFVIDDKDYTQIYGKLNASGSSYTLDGSNATGTLSGITLSDSAQVNLTRIQDKYIDIPITAGNTIFAATNATGNFTVDYTKAGLGTAASLSTDATGISLIGGGWNLTDTTQTVTAASQVIQLGASGAVQASIVSGGVKVTGLDAAGEIVKINNRTYQLNSSAVDDSGISVSLTSDSVATVKDITDEDNFAITESGSTNTFIKKSAGFIKKNSTNNYLWINSAEVTVGAAVMTLTLGRKWQPLTVR